MRLLHAECREAMRELPENSVDAIVTDPPYGLEFMGKEWDRLGDDPVSKSWDTKGRRENTPQRQPNDPGGRHGVKYKQQNPRCNACGRAMNGRDTAKGFKVCSCDNPQPYMPNTFPVRMQSWHESWAREAYRVLKPGGHLIAFGGSRTYHRLACAVEDAGFEIRDQLQWLYGSGFPKSHDVSKAIDKAAGAEREVIGTYRTSMSGPSHQPHGGGNFSDDNYQWKPYAEVTNPATDLARQWDGWGTALKPAHEPIVLARKPLIGTVAANVTEHGTGALNIAATRIEGAPPKVTGRGIGTETWRSREGRTDVHDVSREWEQPAGRWPANVILGHSPECREVGVKRVKSAGWRNTDAAANTTQRAIGTFKDEYTGNHYADPDGYETVTAWECAPDCAVALLDAQSGERRSAGQYPSDARTSGIFGDRVQGALYSDSGGPSRFFYTAKSSRAERNAGLDGMPERVVDRYGEQGQGPTPQQTPRITRVETNHHPTVKPIALMRWLVRLITPPGGTVLDPFMGSGTTGIAAALEGFDFIGVEQDAEYLAIAERRIAHAEKHGENWLKAGKSASEPRQSGVYANGKGRRAVPRCPEHDGTLPSGWNTYTCGCKLSYRDYSTPTSETEANDYGPLFAMVAD